EELRARARAVNSNVRLDRPRPDTRHLDAALFVNEPSSFWSSGWWFGHGRPAQLVDNPLGAMAAGILAYGELMKQAFQDVLPMARPIADDAIGWSLLDYAHRALEDHDTRPLNEPID